MAKPAILRILCVPQPPPVRSTRIPTTAPRPQIVALLCDADFHKRPDTGTWSHRDGRPFTEQEQDTAFTATRVEMEEVHEQLARYRAYVQTKVDSPAALESFLAPFFEQLRKKTLGNAVELMNKDELAELNKLLTAVSEPLRP
ncbi:hypothetical protein ACFC4C_37070, partial [Streptomyces sp. NPDC056039]|uniref:hypothetical protein n=1 Tax=Streptomyces sp. NPDC056039 TaxID=3345687 RepID=UPI0035DF6703